MSLAVREGEREIEREKEKEREGYFLVLRVSRPVSLCLPQTLVVQWLKCELVMALWSRWFLAIWLLGLQNWFSTSKPGAFVDVHHV